MGEIFAYVVFEIQYFSAIPRNVCHPSRSITSWTSFLQCCHLRNIVFFQEDHPLNCPFCPKIFYATLHWWTTHITMFFRLIMEVTGHYECFSDVYTKFYRCSLLRPFRKHHFSSYENPCMIDSNPDNSATCISKLYSFKFCRCNVNSC
jgi:hypothetical protein